MTSVVVVALAASLAFFVACTLLLCVNMSFLGCMLFVMIRTAQRPNEDFTALDEDGRELAMEERQARPFDEMESGEEGMYEVESLLERSKGVDVTHG